MKPLKITFACSIVDWGPTQACLGHLEKADGDADDDADDSYDDDLYIIDVCHKSDYFQIFSKISKFSKIFKI